MRFSLSICVRVVRLVGFVAYDCMQAVDRALIKYSTVLLCKREIKSAQVGRLTINDPIVSITSLQSGCGPNPQYSQHVSVFVIGPSGVGRSDFVG